jgi:hypothetical protein
MDCNHQADSSGRFVVRRGGGENYVLLIERTTERTSQNTRTLTTPRSRLFGILLGIVEVVFISLAASSVLGVLRRLPPRYAFGS